MKIVLVHGTWAKNAGWARDGSSLRIALSQSFRDAATFEIFQWSGRNSFGARARAAKDLRLLLTQGLAANSEPIVVIAHSHGGNIAYEALGGDPLLWPRPGNLWAILDRMNGPMCAAALIDNGLRDGAGLRSPVFIP